ncbi:PQQ-dependent sugar dehydrogenase [Bacteriovorax sp. PP10]|uniref:PQQ-dependent sugar dehydrogenase n=1 Tax=Bacteriovorax antarcticus TaxID=3088717 RepID=A0ABU5VYR4_9BACT|nr:PQQ-dependent sugar dehydrogenase [Bacteriovorax sp. PP10]MEA9357503.1 PQQ-dependent sugar dehydrogenase [Bacteriovorax sp. PP10]
MKKFIFLIAALSSMNIFSKDYVSEGQKFTVETLFEGKDVIWGFDFLNPKEESLMIFTERDGKMRVLDLKTKKATEITGVPKVFNHGQGGLLDVYVKNDEVFLTYSDPVDKKGTTSLMKGKLSSDKKSFTGTRIFQAKALESTGEHFGSRIAIDKDGFLFMGVGERNIRSRAQDLTTHHGKILRLTTDGKAPSDNPFVKTKDALPEIWSYGHRNPQGLIIDSKGVLLDAEFGPRGGDEVNLIEKGANYGWPVITYGREYWGPTIGTTEKAGMKQPLYYWVPSISPSGMMMYEGRAFPKFEGNLFLATLAGSHLHRIVTDAHRKIVKEEKLLEDLGERFRQVKTGPDGLIYLSTDSGKILRLKPVP